MLVNISSRGRGWSVELREGLACAGPRAGLSPALLSTDLKCLPGWVEF